MPVYVKFFDHSIGSFEKMVCEVTAFYVGEDKEFYYLAWWLIASDTDIDTQYNNCEKIMILKSAVIEFKELKKSKSLINKK